MQPNWIVPHNSPFPHTFLIGFLLALACGVVGGLLWVYFRDIAGDGSQPVHRSDEFAPSSLHREKPRDPTSGGFLGLVFCLILGSTAVLFMGNVTQFKNLLKGVQETDTAYYYPDRYPQKVVVTHEPVVMHFSTPKPSGADWTDNSWTANDAAYVKIRHEIDQTLSEGTNPDSLFEKVRKEEQGHLKNPLSVFRLAYVAQRAAYHVYYHLSAGQKANVQSGDRKQFLSRRSKELTARLSPANATLFGNLDPHSYEYARLKFLYWKIGDEATRGSSGDFVEAQLLLEKNPHDWEVKQSFSMMLASGNIKSRKEQALKYATQVVHANPNDPTAWETLGSVNGYFASVVSKEIFRTKYAPACLAAYQKCLKLAPADYGSRSTIEIRMKHMKNVISAK